MHHPATKKRTVSPIYLDDDGINQPSDKVILRTWERPTSLINHGSCILSLLPDTHQYIDVYGVSNGVTFARPPAKVETYNDINGDVHNFFRVLREHGADFTKAEQQSGKSKNINVNRAWRFHREAQHWGCKSVQQLIDRFMRIQIENRPALDILRVYDTPDALFFIEIPYILKNRKPVLTMNDEHLSNLKEALEKLQGKIAIAGLDDIDFPEYNKQDVDGITIWRNYEIDNSDTDLSSLFIW